MNIRFNSAMKKASIGFAAALVIIILIACLVFDPTSGFFWVNALFMFLGYAAIYGTVMFYLYDGEASFKEYPANYPLIHIAIVYSIAQILLVIAFIILNAMLENGIQLRYYWAAELLLLLIFGIRYAIYNSGRKYSVNLEKKTTAKVIGIRMMTEKCMRVQQMVQELPTETREDASRAVRSLEEKVRYSDPMSDDSLMAMDYDIERGIDQVAVEVENLLSDSSRDIANLNRKVREVNNLIDARNNRVKMMK